MMENSCSPGIFWSFLENQMWDIRERQNSRMFLWIEQTKDRKKESESEVTQSCPTLWDPLDCSPPGSSVYGIFQARILEWVAISFSRGSSRPRNQTWVSRIVGRRFTVWATREVQRAEVGLTEMLSCVLPSYVPYSKAHLSVCTSSHWDVNAHWVECVTSGGWLPRF